MTKLKFQLNAALLSLILAFSAATQASNLPDLGSPGLVIYDRQTEVALGRAFTKALHTQFDLVKDPEVLSYVRRIGHRVASHAQDGRHYRFYVINDNSINAFAGPNGIIGIHSGLILIADSEDELASVIAHEIAHITQEHLSRRFEQQSSMNITSFASLLAAILIGSHNPSAGIAALMGTTGLSIQQQLKHSRIHEHEADHLGIELLYKAGYQPVAMADFFGKLSQQQQLNEFRPPEILMTHPVSENRLAQAANRAHQLGQVEARHDPINLKLIQQRLTLSQPITNQKLLTDPIVNCYRRLSLDTGSPDTSCLNQALERHPNNRLLKTLSQKIAFHHEPTKALEELQHLTEIYPQDEALLLLLARYHREHSNNETAQKLLISNLTNKLYKFELYQELSQSFASERKMAEAYLFEAKAYLDIGDLERARHLIRLSQESTPTIGTTLNKKQQALNNLLNPTQSNVQKP